MPNDPSVPEFVSLLDKFEKQYFVFNLESVKKGSADLNNATETGADICTFLSETIKINRRATGTFSTDLTSRDDLTLAIISLILLLVIEGTLTTILLRSNRGRINTLGFSVKQFIELAREFKFRHLLHGRRGNPRRKVGANRQRRKINIKLLVIASFILLFTFGLEVVILYLSSPQLTDVKNTLTAFQLTSTNPDWNEVHKNARAATIRPCTAIIFSGVDQGSSQISSCLTAQGLPDSVEGFERVTGNISVTIRTTVHEYGDEHNVKIGDLSANYSARAYFFLGDGKPRLMRRRVKFFNKEPHVGIMHKQVIAYLFTAYARETMDESLDIDVLNNLPFKFTSDYGPAMNIIQIKGRDRYRQVTSVDHTTVVKGPIPGGAPALQFAQAVFKGSIAVSLGGPDRYDLILGSSNTFGKEALMWRETSRSLNWLSLSILLGCALVVFGILRFVFKPFGTAEIAGAYVTGVVGAEKERPPALLADDERDNFSLAFLMSDAGFTYNRSISGLTSSLERTDDISEISPETMSHEPKQEVVW